ncbi:arginine kinase-like [Actinia tenebrosa]|uniref:Arginine kinase-like n=1 Tax=Actinia tenebrosa TaxID=6105 RepID=A0A6P8HWY1_ACTTE|nr:arginine kinase-like [Actinia tenebrosa]
MQTSLYLLTETAKYLSGGDTPMAKECKRLRDENKFPEPLLSDKANPKSLVRKYLTRELFESLKDKKTPRGVTLWDCINSGVENLDSGTGVYAGDEESYKEFAELFDKIIEDYHSPYKLADGHVSDMNPEKIDAPNVDPENKFIRSTRIRVARNLKGYGLTPTLGKEERKELEKKVVDVLNSLTGDLAGTYYPLSGMDEKTRQQLVDDHFLFKKGDRFLEAAGINKEWPEGRGIYHNNDKTFLVWVNEEDQLRIISMEKGSDIGSVFSRLCRAVNAGVFDISNRRRLGLSEVQCVQDMYNGVKKLLEIENAEKQFDPDKFPEVLNNPEVKSLLKKHLSQEIFNELKDKKTSNGVTLLQCINSGLQNLDSSTGVYAGDEESYTLFAPMFDKIIEDYHSPYKLANKHTSDMNPEKVEAPDLDADGFFIRSTRIRVARNLKGYALTPAVSKEARIEIEKKVTGVLNSLTGDLSGTYYPLQGMSEDVREQLVQDHFLFKKGDRFLEAAGVNKEWPEGRGIFHNNDKTFLVWVNEEDQLRIISRGIHGEHSVSTGEDAGVFDISNRRRLGLSEVQCVQDMYNGVKKLLEIEQAAIQEKRSKFPAGLKDESVKSLLKKYLTEEMFTALKDKKTSRGSTLYDCINSGVENLDSSCGVYACDEECYEMFSDLFNAVIEDYHGPYKLADKHVSDMSPEKVDAPNLDSEGKFIRSTRIRVARNVKGFALAPGLASKERVELEEKIVKVLASLTGDLAGKYYPLSGMDEKTRKQLVDDHFLFKKGDRFLEAAGINKQWPEGRGIFHNNDKTFLVWEDAGVFDISNRRRLGLSEVQCVQDMYNGVKKLMEIEQA